MDRNLQILGITNKAGMLAVGCDAVSTAAANGKAKLILSASDASDGTRRRARTNAKNCCVYYIDTPFTKDDFGSVTRRGSPVTLAILDMGLAARFVKGMAETYPARYDDEAEQLAEQARKLKEKKKQTTSAKRRAAQ